MDQEPGFHPAEPIDISFLSPQTSRGLSGIESAIGDVEVLESVEGEEQPEA